jgi:hypothetical protein
MEIKMNPVLAAMAIATLIGSAPAVAQSWDPDFGSGNIAPAPYGENLNGSSIYEHDGRGFNAHAEAPRHYVRPHDMKAARAR